MTDDEIRIAVAECCGWKRHCVGATWGWQNVESNTVSAHLPNFPADLNACHEMEKTLSEDDIGSYLVFLARLTANPAPRPTFATARQRCEAFLKVKSKWKE